MKIKGVIFDLDGTLYDYETCNRLAEKQLMETVCSQFGISGKTARTLFSEAKRIVKKQAGNTAASHNRLLYMQILCELQKVPPLVCALDFYEFYWSTMLETMQLYPYVKPVFKFLHQHNCEIGILTDLTAHIQHRKIRKLGIEKEIDYFTSSEEAGAEKPSDIIFEKMLQKIPCKPQELLMIGDNQERDVQGAVHAGMQAILFRPNMDILEQIKERI